ncbi:MAG: PGPGW domain-containing protein [Actinomycetota bacterium]|nr:PGPGW domain-containing protein [Actinomycetota bacterium]
MRRHLTLKNARRVAVAVIGGTIVLLGVALLVLPGPGWVMIFAGLALLGTEFVWARRWMRKAKEQAQRAKEKITG